MRRNRLHLLYGSGYLGIALTTYVVGTWTAFRYAPPPDSGLTPLLPAAWAGFAFAIGRLVDAVSDPIVGAWSDRFRGRLGRRIPFMRLSALPLALTFVLLWVPPASLGPGLAFAYLAVMSSLFFLAFTLYVAPYLALLPELAGTPSERARFSAWQGVFNVVGIALGNVAFLLVQPDGFFMMAAALGLISLASFAVPSLTVTERMTSQLPQATGVWESIRLTLANQAFRAYVGGQFFFWIALYIIMAGAPYLVTVVMGGSQADTGLALGLTLIVALACYPFLVRHAGRHGFRASLTFSMAWYVVVLLLWGLVGRLPISVSPFHQGLVIFALGGLPLAGLLILPNALVAEIVDLDEAKTGTRREATFFGVQGLIVKAAIGLSAVVTTQVIDLWGYSTEAPWGVLGLGPVAASCVVLGLLLFRRYPKSLAGKPGIEAGTAGARTL